MQQNYNKKRKLNRLKASLLFLMMVLFAGAATAQTNVYMHSGTQSFTQGVTSFNFYDSGGASSISGSYYWEKWYQHNENATIVFKNGTDPIQVSFGQFHAWDTDAAGTSVVDLGLFSLRINNDHLYVYDGESVDDTKLICDLTGTIVEPFTITANGPITFKFVSDGQYRDEGWAATVTSPNTYTVQKPIITKETCADYVILYSTANGGQIYYTTDGNDPDTNDPLSNSTLYTNSFAIDLDASTASVLVKAIVVADGQSSAVASHTFTHNDQRPTPNAPEINISGNTVTFVPDTVPPGINETYNIRYTTNGTEPSATNGTLLTKSTGFSIEWHTPNTTFKAVTVAVTCSSRVSTVTTEQFGNVTVPAPTITFDADGKAHISCSLDDAIIYYTTNGTQPSTSSAHGTTPVTTDALAIGTTVYAYAVFNAQGYDDSEVVSAIYVPSGGNNVYGDIVLLDDREPHTWSYYSDSTQPVHRINPADVKITYFGYGNNTMTTTDTSDTPTTFDGNVASTAVAVGPNESGNQFIYLKTLENAEEDGSGNYPYTLIPNPFSVRPAVMGEAPVTRPVYLSWGRGGNGGTAASGTIQYSYYDANGSLQTSSTITINGNNTSGNITVQAKIGTTISVTLQKTAGGNNRYVFFSARNDNSNGYEFFRQEHTSGSSADYTSTEVQAPAVEKDYRGFYAWRVKRLSGVTIDGYGVGDIIPAETEIKFVAAANSTNNEVDFEALWAQAYVNTSNSATGLHAGVSYERNFIVGTTASSVGVPVTYSSYYPDGTSAGTASVDGFTCAADTKFEYMTISGGTFTAANHYLCMGRGLTGTAALLQGIDGNATDLDYTLRVESGTYTQFAFVRRSSATVIRRTTG